MNTFDEIVTSILKSVEKNPSKNIDEVIAEKMAEMGLSAEGQKTLAETNKYLEAYDEMYAKLLAAKAEGETRDSWIQEELLQIADKHNLSDKQKEQFISDVAKACNDSLNETLKGGE